MLVLLAALVVTYITYDDQKMQKKLKQRFLENEAGSVTGKD